MVGSSNDSDDCYRARTSQVSIQAFLGSDVAALAGLLRERSCVSFAQRKHQVLLLHRAQEPILLSAVYVLASHALPALREQARSQGMASPQALSPWTRASAGLSTAGVTSSAPAAASSGHQVIAQGFDGMAAAPKTPGVPVSVGEADFAPLNPAGTTTNLGISVSGLAPSAGKAARNLAVSSADGSAVFDGQGHVAVREARPGLPVELTSAPPHPLSSGSGPGMDGNCAPSPPRAMVASVTPLASVVPDDSVAELPSASLTSSEPTVSSQSSTASVSVVPSTATNPPVSAGSSVVLQSRTVRQGIGDSAAREGEDRPRGSAIQEGDTRGAMSVAPEILLSLQRQVQVLKQELAMVSVRQLAVTGVPTGDTRCRGIQTGSDGRGSGLEVDDEPYPSHGYPVREAKVHQDQKGGLDAVEKISPPMVDLGDGRRGGSWSSEQRAGDPAGERVDDRDGELRRGRGIGTNSTPPNGMFDADAVHDLGREDGRRRGRRIEGRDHEARAEFRVAGGSVRSFSELSLPGAVFHDWDGTGVEFSDPSRSAGSIFHVDADDGPVTDGKNTRRNRSPRVRTRFGFEGSPVRELRQDVTTLSPSYGHQGKGVEPPRRPHTWFEADSLRDSTDSAVSTGNEEGSVCLRGRLSEKALGPENPEWTKNRRRQEISSGGASKLRVSWGSSVSNSVSSRSDGGVSSVPGKSERIYPEGGGRSGVERRQGRLLGQRDQGDDRADLDDAKGRPRSALEVGMPTSDRRTVGVESRTVGMARRGTRGTIVSEELDRRSRAGHRSRFSEGTVEVSSRSVPRLPTPLAPSRRDTTVMSGDSGSGSDHSANLRGKGRRSHVGGFDDGDPHVGRGMACCSSVDRAGALRRRSRRGESCSDEGPDARFIPDHDGTGVPKALPGRDTGNFFDSTLLDLIDDLEGNEEHHHGERPGVHDKENLGYDRGIARTAPVNQRRRRDRRAALGGSV